MKAKMTRRILAAILSVVMVLALIPAAFASNFPDVPDNAWYAKAVDYCFDNGLMAGMGNGFEPNGKVTREQAVRTLYAMSGSPATTYEAKFSDVAEGKWYTPGIMWGAKNSIVNGYTDGTFGVGQNVTREQIAQFFYKYAQFIGLEETFAPLNEFPDAAKVSSWAKSAVQWAVSKGILSGVAGSDGKNYLKPQDPLTRAQLASILARFHEKYIADIKICNHEETEIRNAKPATCTEEGYTGDVYCTNPDCNLENGLVEKGKAIPALGHDYVEGQCTRCGEVDPDYLRDFVLTDEIAGGKQYIIYSPGHQMVIKNENNRDWNLIPEPMTPEDDKFVETEPGALNDYVWTLVDNGDGTFSFVNGENKIVMWISETYFELTNNAEYPESDGNWKIIPAEGKDNLFFIQHATFSNSWGPAYIECYYNANKDITNISGYTCGNPAGDKYINDFGFQFYGFGKPCQHASTEDVAAVAPSCTEPGYTAGVRCTSCGKWISGHEVVPATGHSYVEGFCEYCGKPEPQGEEVVIYYPAEGKVMTTASKEYNGKLELVAANASLVDDKVVTSATDVAKFIMTEEDGVVTFATADGKYLYADGTHVKLADVEDENTKFVVEEAEGGVYLRCATAQFSGKPQYIEFFSGVFTVFSFQEAKANIYTFGLYPLGEGGGDDGEEADFVRVTADPVDWEGTYVVAYDLSATEALVFNGIADSDKNNVKATVSGDVLTTSVDYAVVVEKSGDGYTFKTKAGYLDGKLSSGAASNGTTFNADARVGSLSWDSTNNIAVMTSAVGTVMRFNNGAVYEGEGNYEWFRFYKPASSVQTPVVLYKLSDDVPPCEHINTTPDDGTKASCTEPGYTAGVKCDDCGKWISGHEVIPATGHIDEDENGKCDVCGADLNNSFVLASEIKDGDQVVIYNPGNGKAVPAVIKSSYYLDVVDITPNGDRIETEDATIIWTVSKDGDNYSFVNEAGTLSLNFNASTSKTSITLDGENPAMTVVPCNADNYTFFIYSATQTGTYGPVYLEYYAQFADFSAYSTSADRATEQNFGYQFYVKGGEPIKPCEHDWVAGTPVAATCTEDGYTPYTCSKCNAVKTGDVVPATGHDFGDDNICDVCGYEKPELGDSVAIFYPTDSKVMTTESYFYNNKKYELAAADATLTDGIISTEADNVALFTMIEDGETVTFKTEDGKYLSADGTNVALVDAEDDNTKFVLEEADGGVYIRCATAQYQGKAQYLEYYSNYFTVYGFQEAKANIYTFVLAPVAEPCAHDWVAGTVVEATCTKAGYTEYTCSLCGKTKTEEGAAATGHVDANSDQICDACGKSLATGSYSVADSIAVGDKIVLVAHVSDAYYAMSNDSATINKALAGVAVTIDGNKVVVSDETVVWEVCAGSAAGSITLKSNDGKYISWSTSTTLALGEKGTDLTAACGEGTSTLLFTGTLNASTVRGLFARDNNGVQFRAYSTTNVGTSGYCDGVTIYKLG